MPNDVPDWTGLNQVNLIGGISGQVQGDVGAPSLSPDQAQETISNSIFWGSIGAALVSFKAVVGSVIAAVKLGAFAQGSPTSVSPTFGQATTPGNLLVAWVTGSGGVAPTTAAVGWVQAALSPFSPWAAIWYKPNCGAGEIAPTFTMSGGGADAMCAQLAEFSGAATASPVDQSQKGNFSIGSPPLVVTNPAADVAFGDLVVTATRYGASSPGTATFSNTLNNGAAVVDAGNSGTTSAAHQSNFTYAIIPAATVAQPVGVADWAYDVLGSAAPAAGNLASVVLPAVPGKTYTLAALLASLIQVSGALSAPLLTVKDGANVIWQAYLAVSATAGSVDRVDQVGLALKGTLGNSMTIAFSGVAAGTAQSISVGAYLR